MTKVGTSTLTTLKFVSPLCLIVVNLKAKVNTNAGSLLSECLKTRQASSTGGTVMRSVVLAFVISVVIFVMNLFFLSSLIVLLKTNDMDACYLDCNRVVFLLGVMFLLPGMATDVFETRNSIGETAGPLILATVVGVILSPVLVCKFGLNVFKTKFTAIVTSFVKLL